MALARWSGLVIAFGVARAAVADQSMPGAQEPPSRPQAKCESAPPSVTREIERLLESAGEHATSSQICVDGDGEVVAVKLLAACVEHARPPPADGRALSLQVRYRVTVRHEVGGECSPFPDCAKPPPPSVSDQQERVVISRTASGPRIAVPTALPGVALKTPLGRSHSTGCHGEKAPFVPRALQLK